MNNLTQVLLLFASILGVVGAASFVYAYYLVSLNKNQIEALRGDRDDLIKRVELLESDREELKKAAAKKDTQLAEASAKITVLEGIVTHDAIIQDLIVSLNRHDKNVETHYADYMAIVSQVLQATENLIEKWEKHASQHTP